MTQTATLAAFSDGLADVLSLVGKGGDTLVAYLRRP